MPNQPLKPVKAWEIVAILTLGPGLIWLFIRGFFGVMPLAERFGAVICHEVFGI